MNSIKCHCGFVNVAAAVACARCKSSFEQMREIAAREEIARNELMEKARLHKEALLKHQKLHPHHRLILLSTGESEFQYKVIDIIFAYGNSTENFFRNANPMEAYRRVSSILEQNAIQIGADAVLWVKYDYRVAINQGLVTTNQVFEVFAYGTAVKLL